MGCCETKISNIDDELKDLPLENIELLKTSGINE